MGIHKIIAFSGHGSWELGKDQYAKLPGNCSIKFYTMNMRTLSDSLGGFLDRGVVAGLEPDQECGPYSAVPDMRLFPPHGLHIQTPNPQAWHTIKLPSKVPVDKKNIQVQIADSHGGGGNLSTLISILQPAIDHADQVTFLWAACRAIGLKDTGGKSVGVNTLQR